MEPTIHRGSLIFDDLVPVRDLRAGDVITYQPPGGSKPVTHRIISAKRQKTGSPIFRTQGDANAAPDMRTFKLDQRTQARYRFSVPYLGWAFIALGNPRARFLLLALPALLIALSMFASCGERAASWSPSVGRPDAPDPCRDRGGRPAAGDRCGRLGRPA